MDDYDEQEARILDDATIANLIPYHDDPGAITPEATNQARCQLNIDSDALDYGKPASKKQSPVLRNIRNVLLSILIGLLLIGSIFGTLRKSHASRRKHAAEMQAKIDAQKPAVNWALEFPRLYPRLSHVNEECQAAWNSLSSVPCHEKIFNRGWDNGTFLPLLGVSPMRYVPQLCDPRCKTALKEAYELISTNCSPETAFDTTDYHGRFNTSFLEIGPTQAVEVLLHRNEHTCRTSQDSEYEYCTIEMTERWGIMDGMNYATLQGLESFLYETRESRYDPGGWKTGVRGGGSDGGWRKQYKFKVPPRRYGPGLGETDCGWCTLNWLEHRFNGWKEGIVMSPDSGNPISVIEHLSRLQQASQRCSPTEESKRMYDDAVQKYIDQRVLRSGWQAEPSGDYAWLIKNGVTTSDEPLVSILRAQNEILSDHPRAHSPMDNSQRCLGKLYAHISELPCYIHLTRTELDILMQPGNRLLESYCRDDCTAALNQDEDRLKICRYKKMQDDPIAGPFVTAYNDAKEIRGRMCQRDERKRQNCAQIFAEMNHAEWVFQGRPSIAVLEEMLDELEKTPIPEVVKASIGKEFHSPEKDAVRKEYKNWDHDLETGICSPCVWQNIVGTGDIDTPNQYLMESGDQDAYLAFAERFYQSCVSRGATWLGGLPYGGDDVIWRIQEVDSKVYRFIEDNSRSGMYSGRWRMANEETNQESIPHHRWGTVWHLRAAARKLRAEEMGKLSEWEEEELRHRVEEDAKVWETVGFWGSPSWIRPDERKDREAQA